MYKGKTEVTALTWVALEDSCNRNIYGIFYAILTGFGYFKELLL